MVERNLTKGLTLDQIKTNKPVYN